MPAITVRAADDPATAEEFRTLLSEYFEHLARTWPTPDPPRWQRELDGLPGVFAPPRGRMLVAYADGEPAGVVALVDRDGGDC